MYRIRIANCKFKQISGRRTDTQMVRVNVNATKEYRFRGVIPVTVQDLKIRIWILLVLFRSISLCKFHLMH